MKMDELVSEIDKIKDQEQPMAQPGSGEQQILTTTFDINVSFGINNNFFIFIFYWELQ